MKVVDITENLIKVNQGKNRTTALENISNYLYEGLSLSYQPGKTPIEHSDHYFLILHVVNPHSDSKELYFHSYHNEFKLLRLLATDDLSVIEEQGFLIYPKSQNFKYYRPSLKLTVDAYQEQIFVIELAHDGNKNQVFFLSDLDSFLKFNFKHFGLSLILISCFALFGAYHLFLSISLKSKAYLYFVFYCASWLLVMFVKTGMIDRAFHFPGWVIRLAPASIILTQISILIFSTTFLETKKHAPMLYQATRRINWMNMALVLGLVLFPYSWLNAFVYPIYALVSGMTGCMVYISFKNGFRPAKYYFFAWSLLISFLLIWVFHLLGLLPASILFVYAPAIGVAFEMYFMSLALTQWISFLEEEKNEALIQVKESQDAKYLLRVLYHDLSNPLHIIRSLLFIKRKKGQIDSLTEDFERASDMMHSILKHVRKTQSIKDGKIQLDLSPVLLENVFDEVQFVFKEKLTSKKVHLEIDDASKNMYILSDFNSVCYDVINNIVSNAIKFSFQNSTISISANKKDEFIHLEVKDQGIGMNEVLLDNLFETEVNQSRRGTLDEEGSGYGLILVQKYMELYGGRIEVESREGQGTLIRLIFVQA